MADGGRRTAGEVKTITSFSNPVIKEMRSLSDRKGRKQTGNFLAEGLKLATDGLDAGWQCEIIACAATVRDRPDIQAIAARVRAHGGMVIDVPVAILQKVCRRDNTQTVVSVFKQQFASGDGVSAADENFWIGLDHVRDPGNLGTIIRTADAVGASGVVLIGETVDPFSPEAVRATMGSLFHVPLFRMSREEFAAFSKNYGGTITATHLKGSVDYRAPSYSGPSFLLMGNEQAGLSDEMASLAGNIVRIPQVGEADSLNLAVATGIMAYEMRREYLSGS